VTSYSYVEWQNWGYQNSETPEVIVTNFGMGDYVGDVTLPWSSALCLNVALVT